MTPAQLRFACPSCNAVMTAPLKKAGQKIACPACGQRLQIPPPPRQGTILARPLPPSRGDAPRPLPVVAVNQEPTAVPVRAEPRRPERPARREPLRDERSQRRPAQPRQPSAALAAVLELVPGFFQVFGIGHIYAGNPVVGILFMLGYWFVLFCNVLLMFRRP